MIIGVAGTIGSGKDSIANYLTSNHHFRRMSFASSLKEILVGLFDLPKETVYGNDAQKNTLTQYKWEDMPTKVKGKSGAMTGREFMQYFGTEICRKIYPNIWTDRTLKDIVNDPITYINNMQKTIGNSSTTEDTTPITPTPITIRTIKIIPITIITTILSILIIPFKIIIIQTFGVLMTMET